MGLGVRIRAVLQAAAELLLVLVDQQLVELLLLVRHELRAPRDAVVAARRFLRGGGHLVRVRG